MTDETHTGRNQGSNQGQNPGQNQGPDEGRTGNPAPRKPRKKSSMKRKAGLVALVGAGVAGILIWRYVECAGFGKGGGKGGGKTAATRKDSTKQPAKPPKPLKRPLRVIIDGDRYLVDEVSHPLSKILELARNVAPGQGPAVLVLRKDSSTARAEKRITGELRARKIDFVMRDLN